VNGRGEREGKKADQAVTEEACSEKREGDRRKRRINDERSRWAGLTIRVSWRGKSESEPKITVGPNYRTL